MKIDLIHLFISPGHNYFGRHGQESLDHQIIEKSELECVKDQGIRGDRFFGFKENYKGQITFFDDNVYQKVRSELKLPDLKPYSFRRNVITRGVDLTALIGKTFRIGPLTFQGVEECRPCYWMDEACHPGTEDLLKGSGGLRARILTSGVLAQGSEQSLTIL